MPGAIGPSPRCTPPPDGPDCPGLVGHQHGSRVGEGRQGEKLGVRVTTRGVVRGADGGSSRGRLGTAGQGCLEGCGRGGEGIFIIGYISESTTTTASSHYERREHATLVKAGEGIFFAAFTK